MTYARLGLHRLVDLGAWWGERTGGLPLPLGGNALLRSLSEEVRSECCRLMRESIQYALDNHEEALNYAMQFAHDMEPELADRFVGMYVNKWTLSYGEAGRRAVRELLSRGAAAGLISGPVEPEFLLEEEAA